MSNLPESPATPAASDTDAVLLRALCGVAMAGHDSVPYATLKAYHAAAIPAAVLRLLDTNADLLSDRARIAQSAPAGGSIGDDMKFVALLDWVLAAHKNGGAADRPRFDAGVAELIAHIDADRARTPQAASAAVPEDWKLVPVEPTAEMTHAVLRANRGEKGWQSIKVTQELGIAGAVYATMLKAAPTPPADPAPAFESPMQTYSWLVKVGKSLDPQVARAALVLKDYYEGFDTPPAQPAPDLSGSTGMRAFVDEVLGLAFKGGAADGGDIQELGVKHGLLAPVEMTERCGEHCSCAEFDEFPQTCYRTTYLTPAAPSDARDAQGEQQ